MILVLYGTNLWGDYMKIKIELTDDIIVETVMRKLENLEYEIESKALKMLSEIYEVIINDELSDFDVVEEIVNIFEKNGEDCGIRHDF